MLPNHLPHAIIVSNALLETIRKETISDGELGEEQAFNERGGPDDLSSSP
jgi:hypothetical protein